MEICVNGYSKIINNTVVLDNINFKFESGTIYGLRGKNGSGKTMFLRALCGLIRPTSGEVAIDCETLGKQISFPRSIGVLIETPSFIPGYSGLRNLQMLASIKNQIGKDEIMEALEKVKLREDCEKKYKKYSLGMKQRLGIAAAIMENPDIIILDEPTNGLDDQGVSMLRDILLDEKEKGKIIILASHEKQELDLMADVILLMENGQLKSPTNIKED